MNWTEKPQSPNDWIGDKNRLNSFFATWWNGTPRSKALLLYGNPGCGKTSSVYAFRGNATVIHKNCSVDGGIRDMEKIYDLVQSKTDLDGNKIILLLDEIEGLTHKSMELIPKIIATTKMPVVFTCNIDEDDVKTMVRKYQWGKEIDIFEVEYPESDVPELLKGICDKVGATVGMDTLERIAKSCNSVRSSVLTLHHYIQRGGKLGKIIPIDIQGSDHEKIRKLLTGKARHIDIDYKRMIDYCLANRVPADDVEGYISLTKMARETRLAGIDEMFLKLMRAKNPTILAPRIKATVFVPRQRAEKKEKSAEDDGVYKTKKLYDVKIKKSGVSLDDIW